MGRGKIQDGKPKSEKIGQPKIKNNVQIESSVDEATVANNDNANDILDKLKSTIEKIKQKISEGAEITGEEFTEWGETLKEIVEGGSESNTKDDLHLNRKEETGKCLSREYFLNYYIVLKPKNIFVG